MKLTEQRLLIEFSRVMLRVSQAQNPTAIIDITERTITRSTGYKKLRGFFVTLSPKKRDNFKRSLRAQVTAIEKLIADATAKGEKVDLADLTIDVRDADTGAPITGDELPRMEAANDSDGTPPPVNPDTEQTT